MPAIYYTNGWRCNMVVYLYDPVLNTKTKTNYKLLSGMTGQSAGTLASYKNKGMKVRSLNCYLIDENTPLSQRREWYKEEEIMGERWLELEGTQRGISISNHGRFKREYESVTNFIMPYQYKGQHQEVKVDFKGKYQAYQVSKLVAHHFIGPRKEGMAVYHKNGIEVDNFVGNLVYLTKREIGRKTGFMAKSIEVTQLDPETLEVIAEYRSSREAGKLCYVSRQAVLDNCHGRTKSAAGKLFRFTKELKEELC